MMSLSIGLRLRPARALFFEECSLTFVGSDNYRAIPIFFGHVSVAGMDADILGGGVHLNVIDPLSDWSAGPIVNYLPKRKSRHGNDRLKQLDNIKGAFEVGGFVAREFGGTSTGEGVLRLKLAGVHDVNNAYDGAKITAQAFYAARSGLAEYQPSSSFRNVTVGVTLSHQLTSEWGLIGNASYPRYVGDTADSPITQEGSKNAGLVGLSVLRRF